MNNLPSDNKLFIPFIMAGDPNPSFTIKLALTLQEVGASILELGVPYSDPLADGPVIQRASSRAIKNEMNIVRAIELAGEMRLNGLKIPIIIFTYLNPVLQLGYKSFCALAKQNGVDGLLIPDLPLEESTECRSICTDYGLELISLVAPTSKERIEKIATRATGFLYCVSSVGVTGERSELNSNIEAFVKQAQEFSNVPVAVGFGISNKNQVEYVSSICDGVIIGSAIVRMVEELLDTIKQDEAVALLQIKQRIKEIISPILNERRMC
ncbi:MULTISPECIES: tryptophan synthase subunit alpha [Bacillus]|uniref:tryptophan synthase subunit alpha n=1 Tax=Bacillus TaxID=1386 RepID=UPI000BB6EE8B|nr:MULTISPECIES: tryptophan synthase subunit alpha [Bacillus]